MFSRKRLLLITGLLLITAATAFYLLRPDQAAQTALAAPPASLPYALLGPYPVGLRSASTTGDPAIPLTLWYPAAQTNERQKDLRYRYPVKMGAPLGTLSIASYPARANHDAPAIASDETFPLVILSPAFAIGSQAYGWLAEHLASYGMVVIAPDHAEHMDPADQLWRAAITRPRDIQSVLQEVDARVEAADEVYSLVDRESIAVLGHSLGGYTALAAAGAQLDTAAIRRHCQQAQADNVPAAWLCDQFMPRLPEMAALAGFDDLPARLWPAAYSGSAAYSRRVDAVVAMAGDAYLFGESGLASVTAPLMVLGGTADEDTPFDWGPAPAYRFAAAATKVQVALNNAGHMVFTGPCSASPWYLQPLSAEFCAPQLSGAEGWDRTRAHHLIRHLTTAFLLAELAQDPAAAVRLQPDLSEFPAVTIERQGD